MQMIKTIRAGGRSIRRDGLYKTIQKLPEHLLRKKLEYILEYLKPHIISRYVVFGEDLRPISENFKRSNISINTNISTDVVEGSININPDTPNRNIIQNCDPLPLRNPYVCEISNVILIGKYPVGISQDGLILGDTIFHSFDENHRLGATLSNIMHPIDYFSLLKHINKNTSTYLSQVDEGVVLTSRWNHYGHWVLEHALKFRFLEEYLGGSEITPTIILEPDPPKWKLRFLSLMGYENADIITYNNPMYLENIVIPSYPEPTRDSFQWLQERVRKNVDSELFNSVNTPDKVWLSRQNQSSRKIENNKEITKLVRDLGFEVAHPETMSIDEQIVYFSKVDVLAGPHGSAFTNMIYSKNDNTRVLELFGQKIPPGFFRLANILDFEYTHVLCEPVGDDMYVDPDMLADELAKITQI